MDPNIQHQRAVSNRAWGYALWGSIIGLAILAVFLMTGCAQGITKTSEPHDSRRIEVVRFVQDHREVTCFQPDGGGLSCDWENAGPPIYK